MGVEEPSERYQEVASFNLCLNFESTLYKGSHEL